MLQLPDGRTLRHRTRREVRTFAGRWPAAGPLNNGGFPTEATELCIEAFLRGRQHVHRNRVPAHAARARERRPPRSRRRRRHRCRSDAYADSLSDQATGAVGARTWSGGPSSRSARHFGGYARFYRPLLRVRRGSVRGRDVRPRASDPSGERPLRHELRAVRTDRGESRRRPRGDGPVGREHVPPRRAGRARAGATD